MTEEVGHTRCTVRRAAPIEIDHGREAEFSVHHLIENAITSLCIALQWCEDPGQSRQIIDALTDAVDAKFEGQLP
jgi:hypothetical protein